MTKQTKIGATSGPWQIDCEGDGEFAINADQGRTWKHVAMVTANKEGSVAISNEEAEANARLVAAAPELLTALKLVATWMRRTSVMNRIGAVGEILKMAEDAIAKTEAFNG